MKVAIISRSGTLLPHVIKAAARKNLGIDPIIIILDLSFKKKIKLAFSIRKRIGFFNLCYFALSKFLESRCILKLMNENRIVITDPECKFESDSVQLLEYLESENFDLLILGQNLFLGRKILNAGSNKFVNVHPAKLPEYRGYAEPAHAILTGNLSDIGFSLHMVSPLLDEGDIIDFVPVHLPETDSLNTQLTKVRFLGYEELFARLAKYGLEDFFNSSTPQNNSRAGFVDIIPAKIRFFLDFQIFIHRIALNLRIKSSATFFKEK